MTAAEVIGRAVGLLAILGAICAGLAWVIKAQIAMHRDLTKPNGGSSTRDSLNRIERDVREIRNKVDVHIEWHIENR